MTFISNTQRGVRYDSQGPRRKACKRFAADRPFPPAVWQGEAVREYHWLLDKGAVWEGLTFDKQQWLAQYVDAAGNLPKLRSAA